MLSDKCDILSASAISANKKGSRRAPTLIFYQKVDFTKICETKNKIMIRFVLSSSSVVLGLNTSNFPECTKSFLSRLTVYGLLLKLKNRRQVHSKIIVSAN